MKSAYQLLIIFLILLPKTLSAQSDYKETFNKIERFLKEKEFDKATNLADSLTNSIDPTKESSQFLSATAKRIEAYIKNSYYSEATNIGDQLISNYPEVLQSSLKIAAEFYHQLGLAYQLTQSNENKGVSYLNQAISLYKQSGAKDTRFESGILNSLARSYYYQGKYEVAIATMKERIALLDRENDKEKLALAYRSIGNSYWGLRQYDNAARYYDRGLDVLFSDNPIDSLRVGQVLHSKGYIHMDQEDYQLAYETFVKASQLLESRNPPVSSPMVWIYGDVGRALNQMEQYEESLTWLQKALNANIFEFDQKDYYQNPALENINDDFQHFMILKLKGQSFQGKYLKSNDSEDLKGMIDCFRLADQQIDNIRKTLPNAEDQSSISYYSTELYNKAISSLVKVYSINPDPSFLELAHYFMEKMKVTLVQLKFLEASAKAEKILPDQLMERDQELLDQITDLKTKMVEQLKNNGDSASILQNQLFESQESYEQFLAEIERDYPAYHKSRFNLKVSALSDIQRFLKTKSPQRAVITYNNFRNELWSSVITQDTCVFTRNLISDKLDSVVEQIRNSLMDPNQEIVGLDSLSQLLLEDISGLLADKTSITFVLDPALQLIPMELLQLDGKYLFESYDIGYHFSATMLVQENSGHFNSTDFVGFAPNFGITEGITQTALSSVRSAATLDPLPGAEQEVAFLSEMVDGDGFMRENATEKNLKNSIEHAGLIHLATHAIVNPENPESSYLQLGESEEGSEDGKLHFFEIYNLKLNAQLVTLSACNTGYGEIRRGEGVMSLSRAFAYAGVPATVVSLWPASDTSTPELMKFFYTNLKDGLPKDVALNNARKEYLASATGKARHPFYWGGFVLIGDNQPLEDSRNLLVYLLPSVLVIVMILTVYRRRKKTAKAS